MRFWLAFASLNGFAAVLMGALGVHAFAGRLAAEDAARIATAERYQVVHALALGLVAALVAAGAGGACRRWLHAAGAAFAAGMVLFCGGLYVLALTGWRPVAMLAPAGGLALMLGWLALACAAATWRRPG
jgi:uncharacterized membrane protein YgdD (TMEM256/DUF423 family)